ncbi:MAG: hypothetical protein K9I48_04895 [Sphingobacteriales bacterium]|nr:hypothetical protein [Sphingobacteriales bacterium]
MTSIKINAEWEMIKVKVKRKYRDLTDADLAFIPGQEEELVTRLMKAIQKDRTYVEFMLKKMLLNMDTNRL